MSGSTGPTLDLNLLGPTLDPSITFTRASTATYFDVTGTLQTGAINAPRFDYDPVAHTPRGLLIEEARTNYALQSGAMSVSPWNPIRVTATANATTAPDGTTTAASVVEDTTAAQTHYNNATVAAVPVNAPVTASVFLKNNTRRWAQFQLFDNTTTTNSVLLSIDLSTGTIGAPTTFGAATSSLATITPFLNGWYRVSLTATLSAAATTGAIHRVFLSNAMGGSVYTGDGVSGLYMWGAQVEAGAFPTSYIPTTAGAVTRAADVVTMPTAAWFNAALGSASVDFVVPQSPNPSASVRGAVCISDGTANNRIVLGMSASANTGRSVATINPATVPLTIGTIIANTVTKSAASWDGTTFSASLGGSAIVSGAIATPPGMNVFTLGNLSGATPNYLNGSVSRIRYWPRALSNSELQAATSLSGPLLDLYLTGPTLPTGLTLTRSTTGTYVDATGTIQTAAINAPRFGYDPISHAPLGLLIEETRTNLIGPSGDQSAAGWGISPGGALSMTPNAGTAPDGTNAATSVVTNDTSTNGHALFRAYTGALSTTYCGSLFVKANAYPRVSLSFANTGFPAGNTGGLFDLTTGTIVTTSGTTTCSITPFPNGWYRISMTATSNGTGGSYVFTVYPEPATVTTVGGNYTPASTGLGIFTWGAQVETAAFLTAPTSYIPTPTTATVARAFDLCSMPTAAWYSATAGSFAVDGTMQQVSAGNQDVVGFDDGSINNCTIARVTSNQFYIVEASGGVGQASANTANTVLPGTPFRAAMTYNAGALTGSLNGGAVISSSGTAPVTTNRLNLSAIRQAAQNGFKSRVRYWPRVLANVELQEATSVGVQARAMVLA
jgi:hypothetical protein